MQRLVLDTCFAACSVAVITPDRQVAKRELMQRGHAEALVPMIHDVMKDAVLGFCDLDEIAVTTGPGTFTGMRVGIAAARAMALAAGTAIAGLGTLQLMAWGALQQLTESAPNHIGAANDLADANTLTLAIDARRGQIYFQRFSIDGEALSQPQVLAPDAALADLPAGKVIAVGNGADALTEALRAKAPAAINIEIITALPNLQPDARDLGLRALQASNNAQTVKPLYLRPADAKPQIGKTIARA